MEMLNQSLQNSNLTFLSLAPSEAGIGVIWQNIPKARNVKCGNAIADNTQRQHGNWIPMKAIEEIADRLDMPKMQVLICKLLYHV